MAGSETSSSVFAHTLLELACHPEKQKRLRDELHEFNRAITYDNVHELVYLDGVVMEG
jgi:cytochrome P450